MYDFLWFLTFVFVKWLRFFGYFKKNIEFCTLLKNYKMRYMRIAAKQVKYKLN